MRIGGKLFGSLALVVAVGCGPPVVVKQPDLSDDLMGEEDKNVDVRKARALIDKAVKALRNGKLGAAREELARAEQFADEVKREEIRRVRQSVDETEAKKSIPVISKLAKSGKCERAVARASKIIRERKATSVPVFVRTGTSSHILQCLLLQLEIDLSIGRELSRSDDVKVTLSKEDRQTLTTKVTDATVKELIGKFEEPLANKQWAEAKAILDEVVEREEAGDDEYNRIMGLIRDGIGKEIEEKVAAGLADKRAAREKLEEVDALVVVAEWGKKKGSAVGGTKMPAAVRVLRTQLALWSVCAKLNCSLVPPRKSWIYGHVPLMPMLNPTKGKKIKKLRHGTKVWRIAESSGWILLAKKNPGSLDGVPGRVSKAIGWVKASGNKTVNTREMLPPGNSIIGARVWGPFRKGEKDWELGKVIDVKGSDLAVERVSDRAIITVARRLVRFGTTTKGTKVLSRCHHPLKLEPAVIDKVRFPKRGDPVATVTCLEKDGSRSSLTRKEQLGALRSRAAWLPARK